MTLMLRMKTVLSLKIMLKVLTATIIILLPVSERTTDGARARVGGWLGTE